MNFFNRKNYDDYPYFNTDNIPELIMQDYDKDEILELDLENDEDYLELMKQPVNEKIKYLHLSHNIYPNTFGYDDSDIPETLDEIMQGIIDKFPNVEMFYYFFDTKGHQLTNIKFKKLKYIYVDFTGWTDDYPCIVSDEGLDYIRENLEGYIIGIKNYVDSDENFFTFELSNQKMKSHFRPEYKIVKYYFV